MNEKHDLVVWLVLSAALAAQAPAPAVGDSNKIQWHRPYAKARELAAASGRVLLVKPIMGGSNTPKPDGLPCGGKADCEGSW